MKKVFWVVALAVMLSVPAWATVTISAVQDNNDCQARSVLINYSTSGEPARVRAFALKISVDKGAKITSVTNYKTDGVSTAASKGYGIYMGNIQIDTNGTVTSYGSPVAPASAPDNPPQLDSNAVIVEMGSLFQGEANAPGASGTLCRVWVNNFDCNVSIAADATRGGVVREDVCGVTPTFVGTMVATPSYCYTGPLADCQQWVLLSKPASWCTSRQCHGDADNKEETYGRGSKTWVGIADQVVLAAGFRQAYTGTQTWISADFDHKEETYGRGSKCRVGIADQSVLVTYFRKSTPTDCLTNSPVKP